ncbi:MAG: FtsX-like permease family protein [Cytophagales bacterium]|nr:FtsX-like permease family protein [Cytophagales bacterium]
MINILGLSVSLFCLIITYLWVNDELSVDQFHDNENIYKIMQEMPRANGQVDIYHSTPALLAPSLASENPEVEFITRYVENFDGNYVISWEEKEIRTDGAHTDPEFLDIFSFPIVNGPKTELLSSPDKVVMAQSVSEALFGEADPIGKVVKINGAAGELVGSFQVQAVVDSKSANSSLQFDFLIPFVTLEKQHTWINKWGSSAINTFVTLNSNASAHQFSSKIVDFIHQKQERRTNRLFLYPFEDYYLHADFSAGKEDPTGKIVYIKAFIIFGIFILIIGCINYVNLATAVASDRSKEFALRNILGATKKNVIMYILTEALLLTIGALFIALIVVLLFLGYFNTLTGKDISIQWFDPNFILLIFGGVLLTSILSASYPAILFTKLNPLQSLPGNNFDAGKKKTSFRSGLVIFQFCLAILLMVISQIVRIQNEYVINKDLGFQYRNTVEIVLSDQIRQNYEPFRTDMMQLPFVKGVCRADYAPFNIDNSSTDASWAWKDPYEKYSFNLVQVDHDFLETFEIPIQGGRGFSRDYGSDSLAYVVNATAASIIMDGEPLSMLNKAMTFWHGRAPVIGVTQDFHHESLYNPIDPLILMFDPEETAYAYVRFTREPDNVMINSLNILLRKYSPGYSVDFSLLENRYESLYSGEMVVEKLNKILAIVATIISILGLFGLSLYNTKKNEKSIAVRKVLGAASHQIFYGLIRKYMVMIIVSFFIAAPASYLLSRQWLQQFYFHAEIGLGLFIAILVIILSVALVTTAYYTLQAINRNPVHSLKADD